MTAASEGGEMLKRAIVVGASSGIGAALVQKLAREGYRVAAVARRKELLEKVADDANRVDDKRVWVFEHDVTDSASAPRLFEQIVCALDGLDAVIYCAGIMPPVAEDQFDTAVDRPIIEINVIGALSWLNLAAARFQIQRGGMIVGVGSVAGDRGRRGNPAYAASKAALHTYLESLRNRLSRHGVHVLTIKPGPVRTPMTQGLAKMPMAIDADGAAEGVFRAMTRRADTAYVPIQWGLIMPVIRAIPSVVFRRMSF
jgi:NAD(P)-dependent dehydrogenase (short-subunit alcohol dehydrogenase family)